MTTLPSAPPTLEKLLQITLSIVRKSDEALMGKQVTVDYLSILENLQFVGKYVEEEAHLDLILKYKSSLFLNILMKDDTLEPQWKILKSFVVSLFGNIFELDEINDSDELIERKVNTLCDMVDKEDFLSIIGRMIAVDYMNESQLKTLFEDRNLIFGVFKLLNTMLYKIKADKLVSLMLRKQKKLKHEEDYTFAYQVLRFLIISMRTIWSISSNLSQVERSDIFLLTTEIFDTLSLEAQSIQEYFTNQDELQVLIEMIQMFIDNEKTKTSSENEGFSHMMNIIANCLNNPLVQDTFSQLNGVKEIILLIKRRKYAREAGIRTLYYAIQNNKTIIQNFVEKWNGLNLIFALLMKAQSDRCIEYVLEVLAQIVNYDNPVVHLRFLKKFKESSFEKTDRIMELFFKFKSRLDEFEDSIRSGRYISLLLEVENITDEEEIENRILVDRLSNGLYFLRILSKIIAYVCDDQVRERVQMHLAPKKLTMHDIAEVLEEYVDFIDDEVEEYRCNILIKFLLGESLADK